MNRRPPRSPLFPYTPLSRSRDIDEKLVDAQRTRQILDRLYGYEVSPVLWKKVLPRLSAGRVQSVATRMVVKRERERMTTIDRKSTRLNSSHLVISYAVFCLK